MKIPVIYKGDDTDFSGTAALSVCIETDFDLDGYTVTMAFLGCRREFRNLSGRSATLRLMFSAGETAAMPVGTHKALLRVFDSAGRVRTASDDIRIRVSDSVKEAYDGSDGDQSSIDVTVETLDPTKLMEGAVLRTNTMNSLRQAVKAIAQALGATVSVFMLSVLPVLGAQVQTAPLGDLNLDSNPQVVTNVDFSGLLAEHQDISGKVNTVMAYLQGDDVKEVVTNYDSVVHMPSRSLQQRVTDGGSNCWRVVWNEMTRWDWLIDIYQPTNFYSKAQVNSLLSEKADCAWGYYDSHTGGWSPDGYTQISSPKILIAAGMSYQRHVTTGGAVWVLESNGLDTEIGGVASNGFFRISDDEGNAMVQIVKGSKRTIRATAHGITTETIMGVVHCHIPYNVESAEHPTIYATTSIGSPFVSEKSDGSIVNVTWTGASGAWVAEVWPKSASSSLFIKAECEVGGETYIKNTAPTALDGGIMYNGVKYLVVPYSSGGKIYLTLEAAQ